MKRIFGIWLGGGFLRSIWWIVGTAVYQLALYSIKLSQNSDAENLSGIITDPPEKSGDRNPASSPWDMEKGHYQECPILCGKFVGHFDVLYAQLVISSELCQEHHLLIVRVRFLWVNGTCRGQYRTSNVFSEAIRTAFGRPVVPLV